MIEIRKRWGTERIWEYYLQRRYKSRKKLQALVELLIAEAVADEAKKHLEELNREAK